MEKVTNLVAVVGPMCSGKSGKNVELALEAQEHGTVIAFVHANDHGRLKELAGINSRDDHHFPAHYIHHAADMQAILQSGLPTTICIDECQFFGGNVANEMLAYIIELCKQGVQVICSGLERTSEMQPFGLTPLIKQYAGTVIELTAICDNKISGKRCGQPATESHFWGSKYTDISVGDSEYSPVCGACMRTLRPELFEQPLEASVA